MDNAVILDLAMPLMDGLAAAREIAKVLPSLPIVLFTLYDSPQITLAAKEAGVAQVFPKNGGGQALIRMVEELLAKQPGVQ